VEDEDMKVGKFIIGAALLLAGLGAAAAQQPPDNTRSVDQYQCKDVMREHGTNRDVAISFLNGYLLGKSSSSSFDIEALHKRTTDFIEYCLDHPSEKAVDAMSKLMK
jgi:HdeA/HdeB family